MSLLVVIAIAAIIWAMLQFVILPRVEAWSANPIARAGARAALRYVRLFAFVAMLTYSGLAIIIKLAALNLGWVLWLSDRANALHERLERFDTFWGIAFVIVLIAAFAYGAARRDRVRERDADAEYRLAEWQKIDAQREAGTLPELNPTTDMLSVENMIRERESAATIDDDGNAWLPREQIEELKVLYRALYLRDTERRIPPRPQPQTERRPGGFAAALVDQFGGALSDRRVLAAGTGTRRALHVALTVLLCLSLVTATAEGAFAADLQSQAVAVSRLDVQRHHADAAGQLAAALPAPSTATPRALTPQESRAIRQFATSFARAMEQGHALQTYRTPPAQRDIEDLANAHQRAEILNQLQRDPGIGLADVRSLDAPARATAVRIDRHDDVPGDPFARHAETDLRERLSRVPQAESEAFLARVTRGGTQASSLADIMRATVAQGASLIWDGAAGDGPPDIVSEARAALGEGGSESLSEFADAAFARFTDIAVHSDTPTAMTRVAEPGSTVEREGRGLFAALRARVQFPLGWERLVTETLAHPPAAPPREPRLPQWALQSPPHGDSNFATTFADIAPAGYGDDLRSPRHRIDVALQTERGVNASELPTIPSVKDPVPSAVAGELAEVEANGAATVLNNAKAVTLSDEAIDLAGGLLRSRSYALLTGFSRVGGVLIGAPPKSQSTLDCRSFEYRIDGNLVKLSASGPNCPWHGMSLDRDIVARALAYAADGRPVATTMVSSSPLLDGLSVHPHPALVDSQVGREASKIDMFIDTFYRSAPPLSYEVASAEVDGQIRLYHAALEARTRSVLSRLVVPSATTAQIIEQATYLPDEERMNVDDALQAHARTLSEGRVRQSVLRAKPAYFDSSLVDIVEACESARTATKFASCAKDSADDLSVDDHEQVKAWVFTQPVNYHIESGVRETPYAPASALTVNDDVAAANNGIGPFRFELHVTFFTNPTFAKNESEALRQDEHPYDFPELEPSIRLRIASVARTHPDVERTLHRMSAFTRAQRFFRAGLTRGLGQEFPVDRVVALAHALSNRPAAPARTLRWLSHPEAYVATSREVEEFLRQIAVKPGHADVAAAAATLAVGLHACTVVAVAHFEATHHLLFDGATCKADRYTVGLKSVAGCQSEDCKVVHYAYSLLQIMRLRNDLGVAVDDPDRLTPDVFFPTQLAAENMPIAVRRGR